MLPFRILRLRFRIPDNGFPVSSLVELGFWILIVSRIPDSLSYIPDSKTQGCGFHKQRLPTDFGNQIPLPVAIIVSVDRDQRKDCSLSLSLLPKFSFFFCWNSCSTNHPHLNIISQSSGFPPPFSHRGIKLRSLRHNISEKRKKKHGWRENLVVSRQSLFGSWDLGSAQLVTNVLDSFLLFGLFVRRKWLTQSTHAFFFGKMFRKERV